MEPFEKFCSAAKIAELRSKFDTVLHFMWYHQYKHQEQDIDIKGINDYFQTASLSKYNPSYLKRDLINSPKTTKGKETGKYKLHRKALDELNKQLLPLVVEESMSITERANIGSTPFLTVDDINNARKMAELYIILHCWENSVRKFVEDTLVKKIGANWWDSAKNSDLEKKYSDRKAKETKNKWLSPRGKASPLYYIDWGDLVKIMKKFETDFKPHINEMRFVEHRLDDLEKIRNIIAHHGVIPSDDDFDRVVLHFKDWCKQLK